MSKPDKHAMFEGNILTMLPPDIPTWRYFGAGISFALFLLMTAAIVWRGGGSKTSQ